MYKMRVLILVLSLWLIGLSITAYAQDETANIPANLAAPEGNVLFLSVIGDGVQIYQCKENTDTPGTYHWVFAGPQADLYNEAYERVGIHYAGPSWEANDGSVAVGEVVERADAPDGSIPWLLLRTVSTQGNGLFSHISFVQRIDTQAGNAPAAETCTEQQIDHLSRVPYTARYLFYTADPLDMTPADVPDNLQVPSGNKLALQLLGDGVQIYRCQESTETAGSFAWSFVGPEADLLNDLDQRVGRHYSGPTWESLDGSRAVGEVVERADSPDGAIPWLLLRAVSNHGTGKLGSITFVQRLDTVGGVMPIADMCTKEHDQTIVRVPYSALYVFYSAE